MNFLDKLRDKRAMVTGAGQGIGKEIAKTFLHCGCDVIITYHTSQDGAKEVLDLAKELGRKAIAIQADLTKEEEIDNFIAQTVGEDKKLDILVNNAGGLIARYNIDDIEMDFCKQVIDVNLCSMILLTKKVLPYLRNSKQSSIINIASLAGRKGGHNGSLLYATAKGAVITWTRALSTELASDGIRVNSVAPGLILGTCFHERHTTSDSAKQTIEAIPLQRAGNVGDVARAVAYLASEYDGFITGATLDINGGIYAA